MNRPVTSVLVALALGLPTSAAAQGGDDCFPAKDSNEARTMAMFGVPLAFAGLDAPMRSPGSGFQLGIEVSYLPTVDRATATPTTCRPGKGPENTDLLFAAPRPRVRLFLPAGFAVEASWIPPVRMAEVKANLVGVAVSRSLPLDRRGAVLGFRAHATFGTIRAPITCNDAALRDAASVCYQGTRSDDSFRPNVLGIEAVVGWSLGASLRPYLGAGYNHLAPRFQVNFTDRFGQEDRRRVAVNLSRGVLFAGVTWATTSALSFTGELYSAPADAVTARVAARVRLGRSSRPGGPPTPPASSAPAPAATPVR